MDLNIVCFQVPSTSHTIPNAFDDKHLNPSCHGPPNP